MKLYIKGCGMGCQNNVITNVKCDKKQVSRFTVSGVLFTLLVAMLIPLESVAQTGIITGKVADVQTGKPLPYAEVRLEGTRFSDLTDKDGRYTLRRVPSGNHVLSVDYLGYSPQQITVSVQTGERVEQLIELHGDFIELEADRIYVDAAGRSRARALNKQYQSPNFKSVITSEQMDRFTDYSIQDALARIPGAQVGSQGDINFRGAGLDRYNVTVDGQRMASSGLAGRSDRSVDLGMIPTDLIRDLEVIRVLTPDMDADAMSGTINLVTYVPIGVDRQLDVRAGGGLNTEYLKYAGPDSRASIRYAETLTDDLTISVNFNHQLLNNNWESLTMQYDTFDFGDGNTDVIERVSPGVHHDARNMIGGSLQLTWHPADNATYHVRSLINFENREINIHRNQWIANGGWVDPPVSVQGGNYRYDIGIQDISSRQYSFQAGGRHLLNAFNVEYNLGFARSSINDEYLLMPYQTGGMAYSIHMDDRKRPDIQLNNPAMPQSRDMLLQTMTSITDIKIDNSFSGRVDFEIPAGPVSFKAGPSIQRKVKDLNDHGAFSEFQMTYRGFVRLNEFEKLHVRRSALDQYDLPWVADIESVEQFFYINAPTMGRNWPLYRQNVEYKNYKYTEHIIAGYGMAKVDIGSFTILGGARLEHTILDNEGRLIEFDRFGLYSSTSDTTQKHSRTDIFPNTQIVYTPRDLTRLRLAWTKSINRPDFQMLIPFGVVNRQDTTMFRGSMSLDPMISNNLDLQLDNYFPGLGQFTIGLYYKEIQNMFYLRQRMIEVERGEFTGIDPLFTDDVTVIPVHDTVFRNDDEADATVYGVELSWQQKLTFIPESIGKFGTFVNYAWSHSVYSTEGREDTVLPYQSPHVVNAAVDYSLGRIFTQVSYHWTAEQLRTLGQTGLAPSVSQTDAVYLDQYQDGWSDLAVSVKFRISDNFRFWVDAFNLLDRERVRYVHTREYYPSVINYSGGRGFKMGIRFDL